MGTCGCWLIQRLCPEGDNSAGNWGPIHMRRMLQNREHLENQDRRVRAGGRHLTGWTPGSPRVTLGCLQNLQGQVLKSWLNWKEIKNITSQLTGEPSWIRKRVI